MGWIELLPRIAVWDWETYKTICIAWLCWSKEIDIGYKESLTDIINDKFADNPQK